MQRRLLLATTNPGKIHEICEFLAGLPLDIATAKTLHSYPPCVEDDDSFIENARKKAAHYHKLSGWLTLGDDSGLVVDSLHGLPGVRSARFAGPNGTDQDNITKLLRLLEPIPEEKRTAHFVCALSIFERGSEIFYCETSCDGKITNAPRGESGFGYDPVFYLPALGKTFAELGLHEKNKVSHRAKALEKAKRFLETHIVTSK